MYGQSAFLHMCCIIVGSYWKNTYLCNIKKQKLLNVENRKGLWQNIQKLNGLVLIVAV